MDTKKIKLVQGTWELVKPNAPDFFKEFYQKLFEADPKLELTFERDMVRQERMLNAVIDLLLYSSENFFTLIPNFVDLGEMHGKLGITVKDYGLFLEVLLATLENYCGKAWTADVESAWREVFQEVIQAMQSHSENKL